MGQKITSKHLEALSILGSSQEEMHCSRLYFFGGQDLINAALDLKEMGMVNRTAQPHYRIKDEEEIFYSLTDLGNRYYKSILRHANAVNPSQKLAF